MFRSESSDEAGTWSPPAPTSLPSNGAPLAVAALRGTGKLVAVFNNAQGLGARWPLSVALSDDQGLTWRAVRDLEPVGAITLARRRLRAAAKLRRHRRRRSLLLDSGSQRPLLSNDDRDAAAGDVGRVDWRRRRELLSQLREHRSGHHGHSGAGHGTRRGGSGDTSGVSDESAQSRERRAEDHADAAAAAAATDPNPLVSLGGISIDGQLVPPHGSGITPGMVRKNAAAIPLPRPAERHGGKVGCARQASVPSRSCTAQHVREPACTYITLSRTCSPSCTRTGDIRCGNL